MTRPINLGDPPTQDEVPEGECPLVQTDSWIAIEWPVTGERNLVCFAPRYNARLRVEAPAEHWSRG